MYAYMHKGKTRHTSVEEKEKQVIHTLSRQTVPIIIIHNSPVNVYCNNTTEKLTWYHVHASISILRLIDVQSANAFGWTTMNGGVQLFKL